MRLNLTFRQSGELASEDRPFVLSIAQLGERNVCQPIALLSQFCLLLA